MRRPAQDLISATAKATKHSELTSATQASWQHQSLGLGLDGVLQVEAERLRWLSSSGWPAPAPPPPWPITFPAQPAHLYLVTERVR